MQGSRVQPPGAFFGGARGPIPTDLWVLLGVLFVTFSFQSFATVSGLVGELRLTSGVLRGKIWQLATYLFAGTGEPSPWILLELFIAGMFGRDIYYRLGRAKFWRLLLQVGVIAAAVAVFVNWISPWHALSGPFVLMQGQRMVLTIFIAAFATLAAEATILLFFVLPIQAKWFLLLEVLFAFIAFLGTRDLAGFVGIVTGVALTNRWLDRTGGNLLRRGRLRLQHYLYRMRLAWTRKRRGLRVVKDDDTPKQGPWVH